MHAYNHGKIDPSKLAAGAVLRAKRLCHFMKETASTLVEGVSRWWDLQKPISSEVFYVLLGRGAEYKYGVSKLATGRRLGGDGQAFPITERRRV